MLSVSPDGIAYSSNLPHCFGATQEMTDIGREPHGPSPAEPNPPDAARTAILAAADAACTGSAQQQATQQQATPAPGLSAGLRAAAATLAAGLNDDQRLAVRRVLGGADYSLVLGMPGTGKTSLIVAAVSRFRAITIKPTVSIFV